MQQQAGTPGFLQGGAKCRDQFMGKAADETDGVGQYQALTTIQVQAPQGRIQRREQAIRGADARTGQSIEERGLTRVRIANQGNHGYPGAAPGSPAEFPARAHSTEAALDDANALGHQAPVGLQLLFTGPAQADAALLAFQVGPAPYQSRRQVLELRKLHLQLALEGAGTLGEDVQNERDAVQHPATETGFQVAFLSRRQRMIEDHDLGVLGCYLLAQFLELATPDEMRRLRGPLATRDGSHRPGAGGHREIGEFVKIVATATALKCNMNQHGPFAAVRPFKQMRCSLMRRRCQCSSPSGSFSSSGLGNLTLRAGTTVEIACL